MPTKEPVGKIEYAFSGEEKYFYDKQEYLQAYSEAMDGFGVVGGFKATTITNDPATRKAADDLIYGAFGEENPYGLDHYQKKYAPAPPENQAQEAESSEPELQAGQQFFDPDLDKILKKNFWGQFDHPEEYTPEEWEELCNREPPNAIFTITQEEMDQGEIDVGFDFLTIEEFKKAVKDGYYQLIPQSQDMEREIYPEPEPEADEELEP